MKGIKMNIGGQDAGIIRHTTTRSILLQMNIGGQDADTIRHTTTRSILLEIQV
jgi:putative ribosome biogenesis GTPase RsgA